MNEINCMCEFAALLSCAVKVTNNKVSQTLVDSALRLPNLFSDPRSIQSICCLVPCLNLHANSKGFVPQSSRELLEDVAASNLRSPLEFQRNELSALPTTLLSNLSRSFLSLVDSRFRSTHSALLTQSQRLGRSEDPTSLLLKGLLADSTALVCPTTIVTTFRTLAFADWTDEGAVVVPLILQVVLDLDVLGELVTIKLEAPGTLQGNFITSMNESVQLLNVVVSIDTISLLKCMVKRARIVVRQTIGIAIKKSSKLLSEACSPESAVLGQVIAQGSPPIDGSESLYHSSGAGCLETNDGNFSRVHIGRNRSELFDYSQRQMTREDDAGFHDVGEAPETYSRGLHVLGSDLLHNDVNNARAQEEGFEKVAMQRILGCNDRSDHDRTTNVLLTCSQMKAELGFDSHNDARPDKLDVTQRSSSQSDEWDKMHFASV